MTGRIEPNPFSPWGTAAADRRHIMVRPDGNRELKPGRLEMTYCFELALVPNDIATHDGGKELPEGMCEQCVAASRNGQQADTREFRDCGICGVKTTFWTLCSMCRIRMHDRWIEANRPEPRKWYDIAPADAVDLNLEHDLSITAPLNENGERCPWPWEPQQLTAAPLGQYRCPYCMAMVVAGMRHVDYGGPEDWTAGR